MEAPYKINVILNAKGALPSEWQLKKAAKKTLELEGVKNNIELALLFTDDKAIKKLNSKFLGRNEPTDVIAFGAKGRRPGKRYLKGFIGEIAISVDAAEYNAKVFNTTKDKEILLYIIHGILHLLGYGDENKKEKKIMWSRQDKILGEICRQENL